MKTLILEDENLSAEFLQKMIHDNLKDCQVVGIAKSVKEASKLYHLHKPDIMFMDVNLGDHLSFELFDYIDSSQLQVIFTTGYQEFAIKAFKVNAVDYLMKPINLVELSTAVSKAKERVLNKEINLQKTFSRKEDKTEGMIMVWEKDKLTPLKIRDIVKIKSDGTYSRIYLVNERKIHTSKNLGVYEALLKEMGFIRIHRSCLINLLHMSSYRPGLRACVLLSDKRAEAVSKNLKKHLLDVLKVPVS